MPLVNSVDLGRSLPFSEAEVLSFPIRKRKEKDNPNPIRKMKTFPVIEYLPPTLET